MKVKLFSHSDLDGIGCAILGRLAFKDISIDYVDYRNVDSKVYELISTDKIEKYDLVFITDISVNQDIAEMISAQYCDKVVLLDHHESAEWLNQYEWATVITGWTDVTAGNEKHLHSGTNLFYDYLIANSYIKINKDLSDLVETIRRYDTWEWKTRYGDQKPSQLNMLFSILGRYKFVDKMVESQVFFTEEDMNILDIEEERRRRYINDAIKSMIKKQIVLGNTKYNVAVIFAESNISELGNILCETNKDVDFCIIINMQSKMVSYRSVRDDINLGTDIAPIFGGGGHQKSAGSHFDEERLLEIVSLVMKL